MDDTWRKVGSVARVAARTHECDRCVHPIETGHTYERVVMRKGSRSHVWKYHSVPACPA
jgi:hypothetical protein